MPFVIAKVNVPVSKEQETKIKSLIGKAIESVPGKNENYLLFGIEDNYRFYLRGNGELKAAYIQADIFGNEDHIGFDRFGEGITAAFGSVLGIPPENIYIKFDDIKAWSVGGQFEGDMENGYVSVGNGISHIHEIKSAKAIIDELTADYKTV